MSEHADELGEVVGWDRLSRILSGVATAEDHAVLAQWVSDDPARRAMVDGLRDAWRVAGEQAPSGRVDARWGRLEGRIAGADHAARRGPVTTGPYSDVGTWWRVGGFVAAACLVIAPLVTIRVSSRSHSVSREYITRAGQRESVTLSDGTRFTLAPESHLRVPVDYATGNRAVTLDGEAFFAVVHDAAHPFSVRVRNTVATDVGTQFDVRAYANDHDVRVAVTEGRVGIEGSGRGTARLRSAAARPYKDNNTTLMAGDVGVVEDTVIAIAHGADVGAIGAWTHGELVFHDEPLRQAVVELARWYDVDVTITDGSIANRSVSGSFLNAPVADVLNAIGRSAGVRWVRAGRAIAISPVRENNNAP